MKLKLTILYLFVIVGCTLYSQQNILNHGALQTFDHFNDIKGSSLAINLNVASPPLPDYISDVQNRIKAGKFYLKLDLGEDHVVDPNIDFVYSLTFDLDIKENSNFLYSKENLEIAVNSTTPEQWYYVDITSFTDVTDFNVSISSWSLEEVGGGSLLPAYEDLIASRIRLTAEYQFDYYTDVVSVPGMTKLYVTPNSLSPQITSEFQTFSWDYNSYEFPSYQIQLLKLENTNVQNYVSTDIQTVIDWNKALSFEVKESSIDLTISEGTGFYVWRVRPIGNYYPGGIANTLNYGLWSPHPAQGAQVTLNLTTIQGGGFEYFHYQDSEEDFNWIYSRVFTEDNRLQESKLYGDYLGHTRQTQIKRNTENDAVITQQLQDYSGRDAVTTLPVPIAAPSGLPGYQTKLAQKSNGDLFTQEHFDDDDKVFEPQAIGPTGPYKYYSDDNSTAGEENVPNAEGYPYIRTVYFNDGTNQPREVSGVGKAHAIGPQGSTGMGHTTRYLYATPSDDELIRVFGNEAPHPASVLKKITIDPNNTKSVSYLNKEGKVLATALSVDGDDPMAHPTNLGGTDNSFSIQNTLTKNALVNQNLVSTRKIALTNDNNTLDLDYSYPCDPIDLGCSGSLACDYLVEFFVYDINTNEYYQSEESSILTGAGCVGLIEDIQDDPWLHYESGNPVPNQLASLPQFGPGTYIIVKRLKNAIDEDGMLRVYESDISSKLSPLVDYVKSKFSGVSNEEDLADVFDDFLVFEQDLYDAQQDGSQTAYETFQAQYPYFFDIWDASDADDRGLFDGLTFELGEVTGNTLPPYIRVGGGCCEPVIIPTPYQFEYKCPDPTEINTTTYIHSDIVFEEYLIAMTADYRFQSGVGVYGPTGLLPGYDQGEFNKMIAHMIADEYSCDGGAAEYQYECQDLWECWISVVNGYVDIVSGMSGGTQNPSDAADEDNNESGSQTSTDDKVDEEGDKNASGFLLDWIVERLLSDRLRDDAPPAPFVMKLPEQFLGCAGYRFQEILHSGDTPTDANASAYSEKISSPNTQALDQNGDLIYPYIKDPVFAFRFFYYDHLTPSALTPRWMAPEVELCYAEWPCSPQCTNRPACTTAATGYHDGWNCDENLMFYSWIKAMGKPVDEGEYLEVTEITCPAVWPDLNNMLIARCTLAKARCELKQEDIIREITAAFIENCYTIGGCPGEGVITEDEIFAMAEDVVAECKASVDGLCDNYILLSDPYPTVPSYPICIKDDCEFFNGTECEEYNYSQIKLMPDCDMNVLRALEHWQFEMTRDFANDVTVKEGAGSHVSAFVTNCSPPVIGNLSTSWSASPDTCKADNKQLNIRTITVQVN